MHMQCLAIYYYILLFVIQCGSHEKFANAKECIPATCNRLHSALTLAKNRRNTSAIC